MIQCIYVVFIQDYWLHPIKIMLHVSDVFISIHRKSYKPKLYFYTLQSLNFMFANVDKSPFFLEEFQEVSVASWNTYFPYTKPVIKIEGVSAKPW